MVVVVAVVVNNKQHMFVGMHFVGMQHVDPIPSYVRKIFFPSVRPF